MQKVKIAFKSLDKHVCSLKWARRMHEIGIRQDTYFQWVYDENNDVWEVCWSDYCDDTDNYVAAFTAQDFIDLFPRLFKIARSNSEWKFYCEYADMHLPDEENLANVFARILIAITKNKAAMKKMLTNQETKHAD